MRDVNHQRKYQDKLSGNAMVTDKHTHATTITYAASMPISYKLFGKYNNIEEKNQSEYIK